MYFFLSIILIVIDQLVKAWVRGNIPLGGAIPFLPGVMELTYVQNTGMAFSMLSRHTWLLALLSLAVSLAVGWALGRDKLPHPVGRLSLALVLAGGVGNLIDRAVLGFVTDMFATTFMDFAVFNVADICVCVGGALLVLYVLRFAEEPRGGEEEA